MVQWALLPPELTALIVHHLTAGSWTNDGSTRLHHVRVFSLVCRAWLDPARHWLFAYCRISMFWNERNGPRFEFFASQSDLACLVRYVHVDRPNCIEALLEGPSLESLPATFPNVTSLCISSELLLDDHESTIVLLLQRWSRLQHLKVMLPRLKTTVDRIAFYEITTVDQLPLQLMNLQLQSHDVAPLVNLVEYLSRTSAHQTLRSIQLKLYQLSVDDFHTDVPRIGSMMEVLHSFENLEDLDLVMIQHPTAASIWMASFAEAPNVKSLRLPALIRLKFRAPSIGINIIRALRRLLRKQVCPQLRFLKIHFEGIPYGPDPDLLVARHSSALPHHSSPREHGPGQALATFRPFLGSGDFEALRSDAESEHRAALVLNIDPTYTFRVVLGTPKSARKTVVHDTTAFLRLFSKPRAEASTVIVPEHNSIIHFLN